MSFAELLPEVVSLPHAEKFQLVQFLLEQSAKEEGIALRVPASVDVPKPIGQVYHSGQRNISASARSMLFEDRTILSLREARHVDC